MCGLETKAVIMGWASHDGYKIRSWQACTLDWRWCSAPCMQFERPAEAVWGRSWFLCPIMQRKSRDSCDENNSPRLWIDSTGGGIIRVHCAPLHCTVPYKSWLYSFRSSSRGWLGSTRARMEGWQRSDPCTEREREPLSHLAWISQLWNSMQSGGNL